MFGVQRQKPERTRYVWGRWEMRQSKKRTKRGEVMEVVVVGGGDWLRIRRAQIHTHARSNTNGKPLSLFVVGGWAVSLSVSSRVGRKNKKRCGQSRRNAVGKQD